MQTKTKRLLAIILSGLLLGIIVPLGIMNAQAEEPFTTEPMLGGGLYHSLALRFDGTVWAWGMNSYGQLGDGTVTSRTRPAQVPGLEEITAVGKGYYNSLALDGEGQVWGWGQNTYGQLGDGTTTQRTSPVKAQIPGEITAIAQGYYHTLALDSDGYVWAFGQNTYGQLGDGTTTNRATPAKVPGLSGITAIAAGTYHSLALDGNGDVWAWGINNYGQLGDNTATQRPSPVQMQGLADITAITAGVYHTLALDGDGDVWGCGYNSYGQLGDGTTTTSYLPVQTQTSTDITAISAGYYFSIALDGDGDVWAWGQNGYGQVGDGTTTQRTTPVKASYPNESLAISAGMYHSLAMDSDGMVWTCGYNNAGQIGDGTTTNRPTPVQVLGPAGVDWLCLLPADSYTVKYDANGGTGAPAQQTKYHNMPLTLDAAKPTRMDYKFLGWAASATATVPAYQPGDEYKKDSDATLYAVWEYLPVYLGEYPQSKVTDATLLSQLNAGGPSDDRLLNGTRYAYMNGGWYRYDPIVWRVLSRSAGTVVLVAESVLDAKAFQNTLPSVPPGTWLQWPFSSTDICLWLTGTFKSRAFGALALQSVSLLTYAEATNAAYGFTSDASRIAAPTEYAVAAQVYNSANRAQWWLYTDYLDSGPPDPCSGLPTGGIPQRVVNYTGAITTGTDIYADARYGVRPVVRISPAALPTYTVTYNANGGDDAPAAQPKPTGETITLTTDEPTREGYRFIGWATSSTATEPDYPKGGSNTYCDNADLTLFALWEYIPLEGTVYYGTYPQSKVTDTAVIDQLEAIGRGDDVAFNGARYAYNPIGGGWFRYDPIEWKVLESEEGFAYLVAVKVLDAMAWHGASADGLPFNDSKLCGWLNGPFADRALDPAFLQLTPGGTYVSLLTQAEASNAAYDFTDNLSRVAGPTEYAIASNAYVSANTAQWWLHSTSATMMGCFLTNTDTNAVNYSGAFMSMSMADSRMGVRPVIKIDPAGLKPKTVKATFTDYAGTTETTREFDVVIPAGAVTGVAVPPVQNTYTGWTPIGWSTATEPDAEPLASFPITEDTTYYGLYLVASYTVDYVVNGGTPQPPQDTAKRLASSYDIGVITDATVTLPAACTLTDFIFDGWVNDYTGTKHAASTVVTITRNTVFVAKWDRALRTVTYDRTENGGAGPNTTADVRETREIDLTPTASKAGGWTHVGWNTDKDATVALAPPLYMADEDVTLYAIYSKELTATFIDYINFIGQQMRMTRTVKATIYNKETSATITAPAQYPMSPWVNRGWGTATGPNAPVLIPPTGGPVVISANITYFGLYEKTLTLSYNAMDGAPAPAPETGKQYANSAMVTMMNTLVTLDPQFVVTLTEVTREGYNFVAWAKGSVDGQRFAPGDPITINADTTMYALWEVITYAITFDPSTDDTVTGMPDPNPIYKEHPFTLYLPEDIPERNGYVFLGWSLNANGVIDYEPGDPFDINEATTLYAEWTAPVTSVSLRISSWFYIMPDADDYIQLRAVIEPDFATNQNVTWKCDDPDGIILSFDNGFVKTKIGGVGSATVYVEAEDNGLTATCEITKTANTTDIVLNREEISMGGNAARQLKASDLMEGVANRDVTWKTDNPGVATVNEEGLVETFDAGIAVITATYTYDDHGSVSVQFIITVGEEAEQAGGDTGGTGGDTGGETGQADEAEQAGDPSGDETPKANIKFSAEAYKLKYRGSAHLAFTGTNAAGYTWSSSNSLVKVENGKVTSLKGKWTTSATITVKDGDTVLTTAQVNVKPNFWQWLIIIFLFGWAWY